jgi:hypothetical protein
MMRMMALTGLLAVALYSGKADAQQNPNFTLVNATGYTIDQVFASRPRNNSWGDDILGQGQLEDGQYVEITFNTNACRWDLKVVYDDNDTSVWENVNLCQISKLTLFWDRKAGQTRAVPE